MAHDDTAPSPPLEVSHDDGPLARRCAGGDQDAWRAVYEAHFGFVYRSACRLGTPAAEAEDVAHEVFMIATSAIERFEAGRLSTWLYRICANVVSAHHRRRRVRRVFAWLGINALGQGPARPDERAEADSTRRAVQGVLERMAPKKREVLALFELEGLSGPEIAERLGCPLDTVWTRLHHARLEFAKHATRLGLAPEGSAEVRHG